MYVIAEETLNLALNYQRYEEQVLDPTYEEYQKKLKNIIDWKSIKLEPENFLNILNYDMYATRVYIDGIFVGYIDRCNSPIVSYFLEYKKHNLVEIESKSFPIYENDNIIKINLHLKFITYEKTFFELVESMKLFNNGE